MVLKVDQTAAVYATETKLVYWMREKWSEKKTQINNHECLLYQTPTKLQRNEREEKNHECIGIEY